MEWAPIKSHQMWPAKEERWLLATVNAYNRGLASCQTPERSWRDSAPGPRSHQATVKTREEADLEALGTCNQEDSLHVGSVGGAQVVGQPSTP
ncbi:hypothetical protein CYMTET_17935 [Cymbomonas tetramitiformis]|uniref:Uncharacterized protein n=1 Tax=Cymbomonas tetramitiformis TaxID=36881 RepID=A0AAE0GAE2_9CHLO|nr:hypothetical protein CYMTET_17935 [Cymbomonas tetramitiformis]